ncbi:MAG: hypothetical protein WD845_07145, partial [Pirellulales bacterium]
PTWRLLKNATTAFFNRLLADQRQADRHGSLDLCHGWLSPPVLPAKIDKFPCRSIFVRYDCSGSARCTLRLRRDMAKIA